MPHFEIISLLALVMIGLLWLDSLKAREAGIEAVRKACKAEGLQLLDETISIMSLKPVRNERGRLAWQRIYAFEYTETGDNRRQGSVHLVGNKVSLLNVGLRLAASDGKLV